MSATVLGYQPSFFLGLLVGGIALGGVYALFGSGLTMIFGAAKLMNFAQGEVFMIGGYVAWVATASLGLGFWLALPIAAVVLAAIGAVLALTLLRRVGGTARSLEIGLVLTLGLSVMLQEGALRISGPDVLLPPSPWGSHGLDIGGVNIQYSRLLALGLAMVLLAALGTFLRYTRVGLAIRAVPQNRDLSVTVGIRERTVNVVSIAIGFALSGIAGAAVSPFYGVYPTMGVGFIFIGFAILYAGGMSSVLGSVVSALVVGVITSFASGLLSAAVASLVPLVLIVAVLLLRPEGLFGSAARTA